MEKTKRWLMFGVLKLTRMLAGGAVHLWRGAAAGSAGPVMDVYAQLEALLGSLNLPPDAPICLARQARAARQALLDHRSATAAHSSTCSSACEVSIMVGF